MKNDRLAHDLSEDGADLYPHLKLTAERFPRILATRRIEDDDAEYYGAFLTKTSVRILIDFLGRVFQLRSCDIPVDGSFAVPCTQYYRKRCMAPCVANLCDQETYRHRVNIVRSFLADRRSETLMTIGKLIDQSSGDLDFEQATVWRDIMLSIEKYWQNPRWSVWLDDTVDTYDADETVAGSFIYLVTQRGRNVLGRKVFRLPKGGGLPPHEAIGRLVASFYRFHVPREIRVSLDFEGRTALARDLSKKFGREVKILFVGQSRQRVTSARALQSTWSENELEFLKDKPTPHQVSAELRRSFHLDALPGNVEAFDVAHISGTAFAAASTVWSNGSFLPENHRFYVSNETAEPAAMADAVRERLWLLPSPDLIVLDGGKAQLQATMRLLVDAGVPAPTIIGAVKPAGQHSSLSHFVLAAGERVQYEPDNPAHNMLRLLRDAAHDLANRVHRDLRDMVHHYELAAMLPSLTEAERLKVVSIAGSVRKVADMDVAPLRDRFGAAMIARFERDIATKGARTGVIIPLVVPLRFDAENGNAEDLIPIEAR